MGCTCKIRNDSRLATLPAHLAFNAFLQNPEIIKALLAFDTALKNHVSFSERVRVVIILAVGGVWAQRMNLRAFHHGPYCILRT